MKRVSFSVGVAGFLLCALCLSHTAVAQQRRVLRSRETGLTPVPVEASRGQTFLSPDGTRYAYVVPSGSSFKVTISDIDAPIGLDRIVSGSPLFGGNGEHLAIAGKKGDSWHAVFDGKESKPYLRIWDDSLRLNSDGDRLAFVADDENGKSMVVLDDRRGKSFDTILDGSLTFSPDGKHLAYAARDGMRQFVVLDEVPAVNFEKVGRPIFSSNGAHLAYVASRGGKWTAVLDGREGPAFDAIQPESLLFAPDAERLAYVAVVGEKKQAIVAGKGVGEAYPWIFSDSLVFSLDAKHFAFAARLSGVMTVVIDGKEEPAYRSIVPGSIRFSPDGKRVAYIAERPDGDAGASVRVMVVDGIEGKPYRWIRGAPVFSADSKRVAYIAQRLVTGGDGWACFLVLDGVEGNSFPWIRGQPLLSVDGNRAYFLAVSPDERFTDADEMPWNTDAPGAGGRLVLDARPQPAASRRQPGMLQDPIRIVGVEERLSAE